MISPIPLGTKLEKPICRAEVRPRRGDRYSRVVHAAMRNKLQYIYTISVFAGVLLTSYLMMNREGNTKAPLRTVQTPALRTDAMPLDPAVSQLFEMEDAIYKLRKEKTEPQKRAPSDADRKEKPPYE